MSLYANAKNTAEFVKHRENFMMAMRNSLAWGNKLIGTITGLKANSNYTTIVSSAHQARIDALETAAGSAIGLIETTLEAEALDTSV